MQKRKRMSKGSSKRMFKRTANRGHKFNVDTRPMRGGIRL